MTKMYVICIICFGFISITLTFSSFFYSGVLMTKQTSILKEIHSLNLSYLLLAQRLADHNLLDVSGFLSMDDELIKKFKTLTLSQMLTLAETNQCLIKVQTGLLTAHGAPSNFHDAKCLHKRLL